MADINLKNLARMTVSSTGTGTITLNTAVTGFLTFDLAGCSTASAGSIVRYAIADTTKSEMAFGTYRSSSLTLTRGSSTTGMKSTNSNSPIDMSNAAQVFITDADADHPIRPDSNLTSGTLALNMTYSGTATFSAAITYGGVTLSNAVTGTGNMVLSASPTLTGTTTIATLALTTVGAHTISGAITYGGVTLTNAVTGTGSMVLSASPTFTGTVGAAAITATGAISGAGITASAALSGASAGGTMVATQADQETSTSTTTLVSPGRQQFHPSAAKFWVRFDSFGNLIALYNVTSVTDNGVGDWTVNIATDFSSDLWAGFVSGGYIGGVTALIYITSAYTAGTVQILAARNDTGASGDPDFPNVITVCGFGDQ